MTTMYARNYGPDNLNHGDDLASYDPEAYRASLESTPAPVAAYVGPDEVEFDF